MHCGILRYADARLWMHWWTVRGHNARIEHTGRRDHYHTYLTLKGA